MYLAVGFHCVRTANCPQGECEAKTESLESAAKEGESERKRDWKGKSVSGRTRWARSGEATQQKEANVEE